MNAPFADLISRIQKLSSTSRTLLAILGLCLGALTVSWLSRTIAVRTFVQTVPGSPSVKRSSTAQDIEAEWNAQWERIKSAKPERPLPMPATANGKLADSTEGFVGNDDAPLIAHAAELAVTTKEFAHSRASLEEVLEKHHGYAAKLRMIGQPAGSLLTATLRIPSSEFNETVMELKALGNVEREEQTADEITQQRADLEARLTNAQQSLARLQGILAKGGKDLAQVQKQLFNVSGEIARLESERLMADHRVIFAQVLFSLSEEVKPPVESLTAQFRNAAVTGFSDVLGTLSGIVIFGISRGPVILLWVVLIYLPGRWAWRKWRLPAGTEGGLA